MISQRERGRKHNPRIHQQDELNSESSGHWPVNCPYQIAMLENPRTRAGNEWDWDVGKRARVPESKYKILILEKCMYYVSRVNGRELV